MSMIHEITAKSPRYKRGRRYGRGESSGHGKTSGRGGKGASARGGGPYWKPGHEGGQTPLHRRLPTRGFSNDNFARDYYIINLGDLERFDDGSTVDAAVLEQAGLIPDNKLPVKVLGDGNLTRKLTIAAGWYSRSAHQKITSLGGTAQDLKGQAFEFPKPKKKFVPREQAKKAGKGAAGAEEGAAAPAEAAKAEAPKAEAKE